MPPGITAEDWARAEARWRDEHTGAPQPADLLFALGTASVQSGAVEKAFACWEQIPVDHPTWGIRSRLAIGHHALKGDFASLAERSLREALAAGSKHSVPPSDLARGYNELVYLLSVELRLEDRRPILEEMHRLGLADVYDSKMLYFPRLLLWHPASGRTRLGRFLERDPQSLELQIASVRYLTFDGEADKADALLKRLRKEYPSHPGVLAALLECAYERSDNALMQELIGSLPPISPDQEEPEMLTLYRGLHAVEEGHWQTGLLALSSVLRTDPGDSSATMALSRVWDRLGDKVKRDQSLDRARCLSQIRVSLPTVTESNAEACRELSSKCRELPFPTASEAFENHAKRIAARSKPSNPSRELAAPKP